MYIHSTNAFDPVVNPIPRPRAFPMWVLRTGPSPASPAVMMIDSTVRKVTPAENHPPGPVDERVGCYDLERGKWSDSRFVWDPFRTAMWFPDHLRLHWQYQWRFGAGRYLVATDTSGKVTNKRVSWWRWRPIGTDSLVVDFGMSVLGTAFRGAAQGGDYVGKLSVQWDVGDPVWAPARLHRVACPASGEK